MAVLASTALSIGAGLFGASSKKRARRRARRRTFGALDKAKGVISRQNAQEEGRLNQAIESIRTGSDAARAQASGLGREQKRQAVEREKQLASQIVARNAASGIADSEATVRRSLAQDTNEQLAAVDEQLAQLFVDLDLGEAQAEAAGYNALAGFERRKQADELGILQSIIELESGSPLAGLEGNVPVFDFSGIAGSSLNLFGARQGG